MNSFAAVAAFLALVAVSSAITLEECQAKPETGLCRAYFVRHFFNATSGRCEEFVYGGCGGNTNNFQGVEECESSCGVKKQVECTAEPYVGLCRGAFHKFYFNKHTGKCHPFVYGGCGGNTNNFDTEEECLQQCQQTKVSPVDCSEPAKTGVCMALIPSFFYNVQTGQCEKFTYGGCGGNTNRFRSQQVCEATCGGFKQSNEVEPKEWRLTNCFLEPQVGLCKALIPRFHFNRKIGKCEQFTYGGCGGNANNFATEKDCYDHCLVH